MSSREEKSRLLPRSADELFCRGQDLPLEAGEVIGRQETMYFRNKQLKAANLKFVRELLKGSHSRQRPPLEGVSPKIRPCPLLDRRDEKPPN